MDIAIVRFAIVLLCLAAVTAGLWSSCVRVGAASLAAAWPAREALTARTHPAAADPDAPDFRAATLLSRTVGEPDAAGRFTVVRVVRVEGLKFPLLRIAELHERVPGLDGGALLASEVTAADHLMLALLPGEDAPALERVVAPRGGHVLSIDPAARIALIEAVAGFPALDGLAAALAARAPERDALVHAIGGSAGEPTAAAGAQWGLARIAADQAWDFSTGSAQVLVAVIDSGIDYHHPDLAANVWTNPGESGEDGSGHDKAANGRDDDGNGYVDDVHGVDFVAGGEPLDENDHGTHVAGIIGACGAGHQGAMGVCWKVQLAALRILDRRGLGFTSDAVRAVRYATRIGARMSVDAWGGGARSALLEAAIIDAGAHQVLFIAACGNGGDDVGLHPFYPAGYALDNLISVAASDRDDFLAPFSSFGSSVHLAAPGVEVMSTARGAYALASGTAAAAAHVAGACALLAAFAPGLNAEQIRSRVLSTTDPGPGLDRQCSTGGRLNVYRALAPIAVVVASRDPAPPAAATPAWELEPAPALEPAPPGRR
jgi:subtilisin family serine protease